MPNTTQPRNVLNNILGTGEFRFAQGATTEAEARAIGWRDFGNLQIAQLAPEYETVEHEGSYRGKRIVDRRSVTKGQVKYTIKPDEMGRQNLMIALGAIEAGEFTQSVLNFGIGEAWTFGTTNAKKDYWYQVRTIAGVHARELTSLYVAKAVMSVTCNSTNDQVTATGHGLSVGDRVIFAAGAAPGGITLNQIYYVLTVVDANTFTVSASSGGSLVDITSNGTTVQIYRLLADTDITADLKMGYVRFAAAQTTTLTPFFAGSAIASGSALATKKFTPLENILRTGMGEIQIWDDTAPTQKLAYRHTGFSCIVSFKSAGQADGKQYPEFEMEVLVTDTVGMAEAAQD